MEFTAAQAASDAASRTGSWCPARTAETACCHPAKPRGSSTPQGPAAICLKKKVRQKRTTPEMESQASLSHALAFLILAFSPSSSSSSSFFFFLHYRPQGSLPGCPMVGLGGARGVDGHVGSPGAGGTGYQEARGARARLNSQQTCLAVGRHKVHATVHAEKQRKSIMRLAGGQEDKNLPSAVLKVCPPSVLLAIALVNVLLRWAHMHVSIYSPF